MVIWGWFMALFYPHYWWLIGWYPMTTSSFNQTAGNPIEYKR
jgi:hypothetical protein